MSGFRKVFCPTKEEQIEKFEMLIKLHEDQLNHCSTCVFHTPTDMPGFVTDYGSCRVNSPIFAEKVCGLREIECRFYAEDVTEVNRLKELLMEYLKGETNNAEN